MSWLSLSVAAVAVLIAAIVSVYVLRMLRPMRREVRWLIQEIRQHRISTHPPVFSAAGRLEAIRLDPDELDREERELRNAQLYYRMLEKGLSEDGEHALRAVIPDPLLPEAMPGQEVPRTEAIEKALRLLAVIRARYHGDSTPSERTGEGA